MEPSHFHAFAVATNTVGLRSLQSFLPSLLPPAVSQEVCSEVSCLKKTNIPQFAAV